MIPDCTLVASTGLLITQEMKSRMRDNKSCGFIIMNPRDFLDLTTVNADNLRNIHASAEDLALYNGLAKVGKMSIPPFMKIETKKVKGKVIGHEGRHRAAALIKANILKMPVFLVLCEEGYGVWRKNTQGEHNEALRLSHHYRYITPTDFPEMAIGEFNYTRVRLPLETWVTIND
jgi:hypothetical protein